MDLLHPGFNVGQAIRESGVRGEGDDFGGDVKLDVFSIAVKVETMVANNFAKGKKIKNEEETTTHRSLGDA